MTDHITDDAQSVQVPDGYVLMPREATKAMTMAACDRLPFCEHVFGHAGEILRSAYEQMVAAAAQPPAAPVEMASFCSRCGGKDPGCYICGSGRAHLSAGSGGAYQEEYTDILESENRNLKAEIERLRERCEAYKGQVQAGAAQIKALTSTEPQPAPVTRLTTATFDEVGCTHPDNCGWPECDCPRKQDCHSSEAVAYAFSKARELLIAAGFEETAAILHDCKPCKKSEVNSLPQTGIK